MADKEKKTKEKPKNKPKNEAKEQYVVVGGKRIKVPKPTDTH